MPGTTASTPLARRTTSSYICRFLAITALALIVAVGLIVLVIWLVVRPKQLVYTLEEGSVQGFDLGKNKLNGTFNFVLRAYNPNKRMSIYYKSMHVSVWFADQMLAFEDLEPFHQPYHNATRLDVKAEAHSTQLMNMVATDLRAQWRSKKLELDVQVKAKLRFKVGISKSRTYTLRAVCSPAVVHLNSSEPFERVYCDYDL